MMRVTTGKEDWSVQDQRSLDIIHRSKVGLEGPLSSPWSLNTVSISNHLLMNLEIIDISIVRRFLKTHIASSMLTPLTITSCSGLAYGRLRRGEYHKLVLV